MSVGGFIRGTQVEPSATSASGVWTLDEAFYWKSQGKWPQGADPIFASVSLLLHMDGSDASTTFTDNSPVGHTVTANANAQIDTAQSKFGGASGLFDGTGDYLQVADAASLDFGTGDFTVEGWVRPNASGVQGIVGKGDGAGSSGWTVFFNTGPNLHVYQGGAYRCTSNSNQSTGTWYHFAAVRSGSTWTLYVDGVAQTATGTSADNLDNASNLRIGGQLTGIAGDYNGWIDDLRITKGVARYTANFSVPTHAYVNY